MTSNSNLVLRDQVIQACKSNIKDQAVLSWFTDKLETTETPSAFFLAFGMVNRKIDRSSVEIPTTLLDTFKNIDPVFNINNWTLDQFCRLAFLINLDPENNKGKIETLLASADMREQVVIYKSLHFLQNAEDFVLNAVDGIRTNMIDVFDSIALDSAYPSKYFDESAWNQMVLKAIFMERPIFKIYGLETRQNKKLATILHDFVHERWAAGRSVTPELWRLTSSFLNVQILEDLKKVIETGTPTAKSAAIKVLQESNHPKATDWLESKNIEKSKKSWEEIGHEVWSAIEN
ncbi:EboA domain-containing protein [Reichenbachiella sp. MALMAid0571]|uniref:EboA domain-containing protein n=1 Tax=Reichenbachiella sp. MALMAid0571 TaxID=3143939 RepID=UPI0032DFF035